MKHDLFKAGLAVIVDPSEAAVEAFTRLALDAPDEEYNAVLSSFAKAHPKGADLREVLDAGRAALQVLR